MIYKYITEEYYSKWIGRDEILHEPLSKVTLLNSQERNVIQYGYSQQFDVYIFCRQNSIYFSYGDKVLPYIEQIKEHIASTVNEETVKQIVEQSFGKPLKHSIKYLYTSCKNISSIAIPLKIDEYDKYLEFFKSVHPNCKNTDWVEEYFAEMVEEGLCCGIYENRLLVSCTDAPSMPYMEREVQEIGINTLPDYRGKGYAADVCILAINNIINNNKCPQWSTSIDNIASQKLAERVGFVKFADAFTITL